MLHRNKLLFRFKRLFRVTTQEPSIFEYLSLIREKDELFIYILGYRYIAISEYQMADSCTKYFHINASDIFVSTREKYIYIYYGVLDSSEGKRNITKKTITKNNKKNERESKNKQK